MKYTFQNLKLKINLNLLIISSIFLIFAQGAIQITHDYDLISPDTIILADFGQDHSWTDQQEHPRLVADFDNDGLDDIIGFYNDKVYISYCTDKTFTAKVEVSTEFCKDSIGFKYTTLHDYPRAVADIDGDGLADIIGFEDDGVYISFNLGKGNGFTPKEKKYNGFGKNDYTTYQTHPREVRDVDGDGKADLIAFDDAGVKIVFSQGRTGFAEKGSLIKINDFNIASGFENYDNNPRYIDDLDGDGLPDVIGISRNNVKVSFQNQDGSFLPSQNIRNDDTYTINDGFNYNQRQMPRSIIDLNGDGRADIAMFTSSSIGFSYSEGRHKMTDIHYMFAGGFGTMNGYPSQNVNPRFFGKFNHDQFTDAIGFNRDGVHLGFSKYLGCSTPGNRDADCKCNPGFFESDPTVPCDSCVSPCENCESATRCISCADPTQDMPSCQCPFGQYYESGNCVNCSLPCDRCESATVCITCVNPSERKSDATCACKDGFYTASNGDCVQCLERFGTCNNETEGLSCKGDNRLEIGDDCQCKTGFKEDPDSDNCIRGCEDPNNELPSCVCAFGSFDDGTGTCQTCSPPCNRCSDETTCLSCVNSLNRQSHPTCDCSPGYYNDSNNDCVLCPERFATCKNENEGQTCKGNLRRPIEEDCQCQVGHKEDPDSDNCIPGCPLDNQELPSCICVNGEFEEGSICKSCEYPCGRCSGTPTACLTCISTENRNSHPTCDCMSGFYNNSSNECVKCPQRYSECKNENEGITCQGSDRLDISEECKCRPGFEEAINSMNCTQGQEIRDNCLRGCKACLPDFTCNDPKDGYYIDVNSYPKKCNHRRCATCQTTADTCILPCKPECSICNALNECVSCQVGYYQKDTECIKCKKGCFFCQNEHTCDKCAQGKSRTLVLPNCECQIGYYEESTGNNCQKCPLSLCKQCDNQGICIKCRNPKVNPPHCMLQKQQNYHQNAPAILLEGQCYPKCKTCTSDPTKCTECSLGKFRNYNLPCNCKPGFHDYYGNSKDCFQCPKYCLECKDDYNCMKCEEFRQVDTYSNNCECIEGYKENQKNKCQKCYQYKQFCYFQCPSDSIQNEQLNICEIVTQKNSELAFFYWIIGTVLLAVIVIVGVITRNQIKRKFMLQFQPQIPKHFDYVITNKKDTDTDEIRIEHLDN